MCGECGRFGHITEKCRRRSGNNSSQSQSQLQSSSSSSGKPRNQSYPNKKSRNQAQNAESAAESSAATIHAEDEDDAIALVADVDDTFSDVTLAPVDDLDDDLEYYNFDENQSEDHLIYDEWLVADTAATSHITNRRDSFITYESIPAITIGGVGGTKTRAIGRGDINLRSECDGHPYLLKFRNVLHVPENKNNLFSLGRWEKDGRSIHVNDGVIALHMRNGTVAAKGHKIHNNLYKICFAIYPASASPRQSLVPSLQTITFLLGRIGITNPRTSATEGSRSSSTHIWSKVFKLIHHPLNPTALRVQRRSYLNFRMDQSLRGSQSWENSRICIYGASTPSNRLIITPIIL